MSQHCSDIAADRGARRVLFVGTERPDEFADAMRLACRGHCVLVVNPRKTAAAAAFRRKGGRFIQTRIEQLPHGVAAFDVICEYYPYPSGRNYVPPRPFALARLSRLAPGGRWVLFTESPRFATLLRAVADYDPAAQGTFRVSLSPVSTDEAPPSTYPPVSTRLRLVFERCR
jgi:hypothetical protein